MPFMTEAEQQEIMKRAEFLIEMGYELVSKDKYGLEYYNGNIEFVIYYERYGDTCGITLGFNDKDDSFSIGWLAFFANNKQTPEGLSKLEYTLYLLDFIENNYELAISYEEHLKKNKLIEEYVEEHMDEFMEELNNL